jgi:hypothetical protein
MNNESVQYEWREESLEDLTRIGIQMEKERLEREQSMTIPRTQRPLLQLPEISHSEFNAANMTLNRLPIAPTPNYYTTRMLNSNVTTTSISPETPIADMRSIYDNDRDELHLRTTSEPTPELRPFKQHVRSKSDNILSTLRNESRGEKREQKELVFDCYGNKKRKKSRPGDAFEMTFTLK